MNIAQAFVGNVRTYHLDVKGKVSSKQTYKDESTDAR
jgi:hypothetical protein